MDGNSKIKITRKHIYITLVLAVLVNAILLLILNFNTSHLINSHLNQIYVTVNVNQKILNADLSLKDNNDSTTNKASKELEQILKYIDFLENGGELDQKVILRIEEKNLIELLSSLKSKVLELKKLLAQSTKEALSEYTNIYKETLLISSKMDFELNRIIGLKHEQNNKLSMTIFVIAWIISISVLVLLVFLEKIINKEAKSREKKERELANYTKMLSLSELIINLAHQWRQPLSIISTLASGLSLKIELNQFDAKSANDDLMTIVETTKKISKTLDKVGNISTTTCEYEIITISKLLDLAFTILDSEIKEYKIKVIKAYVDYEIQVCKNDIARIIINIVENSIYALMKNNEDDRYIFINLTFAR